MFAINISGVGAVGDPVFNQQYRHGSKIFIAVLLVWLVVDVFSVLSSPAQQLVTRFEDDAFFYATISRHTVEEGILSFDGVSETNGFHPLWMGVLIVTRLIVPDQINFLRAVSALSALLMFVAGFVAVKTLCRKHSSVVVLVTFILLLRYLRDFTHLAMETSILIPLAFIALVQLDKITSSSSKRTLFFLGVTLALIGLARLDAALFAAIVGIWAVKQNGKGKLSAVIVFLPPVAIGILYLMMNILFFDSWMSVSGGIKASGLGLNTLFARQLFLLSDPLGLRSPWGLYLLFFLSSFAVLFFRKTRSSVKAVSLFLILSTVSQLFLSSWRLWYWYAYPAVLFCALCLPLLLQKLLNSLRVSKRLLHISSIVLLVSALILAVFWGWHYGGENTDDFRVRNMSIAEELNEIMSDSTLIAMGDRGGSFAYFFRGGVVQMEGLAGSAELAGSIREKRLQEYLREIGVDYVMSWTGPENTWDYTSWDLHVPDRAQSMSVPNKVTVYLEDELRRWPGSTGTVFLWRFSGRDLVR